MKILASTAWQRFVKELFRQLPAAFKRKKVRGAKSGRLPSSSGIPISINVGKAEFKVSVTPDLRAIIFHNHRYDIDDQKDAADIIAGLVRDLLRGRRAIVEEVPVNREIRQAVHALQVGGDYPMARRLQRVAGNIEDDFADEDQ